MSCHGAAIEIEVAECAGSVGIDIRLFANNDVIDQPRGIVHSPLGTTAR